MQSDESLPGAPMCDLVPKDAAAGREVAVVMSPDKSDVENGMRRVQVEKRGKDTQGYRGRDDAIEGVQTPCLPSSYVCVLSKMCGLQVQCLRPPCKEMRNYMASIS